MWSSQAYACINVEFSSIHWKVFACLNELEGLLACLNVGVLKHTLGGLLACLNVEFPSIHQKVFLLV